MNLKKSFNCLLCHVFNSPKTSEKTHRHNFTCECNKIVMLRIYKPMNLTIRIIILALIGYGTYFVITHIKLFAICISILIVCILIPIFFIRELSDFDENGVRKKGR
jgi:hypothetical protein